MKKRSFEKRRETSRDVEREIERERREKKTHRDEKAFINKCVCLFISSSHEDTRARIQNESFVACHEVTRLPLTRTHTHRARALYYSRVRSGKNREKRNFE
jgi:hypothetical protein